MYLPTKLQLTLFYFLFDCLISTTIANFTAFPQPGTFPPYKKKFDSRYDASAIPNITVVPEMGVCNGTVPSDCNWSCQFCTRTTDLVYCPGVNDWGISFDDGPSNYTGPLLDYLDEKGVKVTFFVIGSHVIQYPELVKRAVQSGHQIGVHTYSHRALTTLSNDDIVAEILWTEEAIKKAAGVTPKYVRPPFGDMDDRVRNIFAQLGYTPVIWNEDSGDWKSNSDPTFDINDWVPGNFSEWVKQNHTTGYISLQHDYWEQTAAQGPPAIDIVSSANFNIKTVAECQGLQPYVEKPKFIQSDSPVHSTTNSTNSSNSTDPESDSASTSSSSSSNSTASNAYSNSAVGTKTSNSSNLSSKSAIRMSLIMGLAICAVMLIL